MVHRQKFLALELDTPERYRKPGRASGLESAMGFGDVAVGVQATDRRFDDLLAAVGAVRTRLAELPELLFVGVYVARRQ